MTPNEYKRELIVRMRARDLAGTLELIADDAVYFWSDGSAMFGKDAIAEGLKRNFVGIENDTYDVFDLTWLVESDDIAACVYRFEWTGEVNGDRAAGSGRGVSILRRIDGEWRTVHENLSRGAWKP